MSLSLLRSLGSAGSKHVVGSNIDYGRKDAHHEDNTHDKHYYDGQLCWRCVLHGLPCLHLAHFTGAILRLRPIDQAINLAGEAYSKCGLEEQEDETQQTDNTRN